MKNEKRREVVKAQIDTFEKYKKELNQNFFSAPQDYSPYDTFLGDTHDHLDMRNDLSKPAYDSLEWIENNVYNQRLKLLDYGCGLSGLIHYAREFGETKGYDNFLQVPKEAVEYFHDKIGLQNGLIDFDEIEAYQPNVMSVCSLFVQEPELYNISSIEIILSDTLYNSGSIQGEGCYHYKPDFDTPPEKFGFVFQEKIRTIDVYVRK